MLAVLLKLFFIASMWTNILSVPSELTIGVLITYTGRYPYGPRYAGALIKAIEDVNNDTKILPHTTLKFIWGDSMCEPDQAVAHAVDMHNKNVHVIIGPTCSVACIAVGHLSTGVELPMISYTCSSPKLTDFEFFSRTKDFARTSRLVIIFFFNFYCYN